MLKTNTPLERYLDKGAMIKGDRIRRLAGGDLQIIHDLLRTYKEVNVLIAELITVEMIIKACEARGMEYVAKNIHRMIESLKKQNAKIYRTKCTFATVRPAPDEKASVGKLVEDTRRRIEFLRGTIIAENLELTPILDYLEIMGAESMTDDLYSYFGSVQGIVEANKTDGEELAAYVNQIMDTVQKAGKMDRYKGAIEKYVQQEEERLRRRKEEEAQKRTEELRAAAEDEMVYFTQQFYRAFRNLENNKAIGVSEQSISRTVNKHGRNGWVILCAYIYHENPVYRYVTADGLTNIFANARIFKNGQVAAETMRQLQDMHPERKYEAVQLQDEETASA